MYTEVDLQSIDDTYSFIILSIAGYGLIVIMACSSYLQEYYNFTRLYLQIFVVLSTVAIIGAGVVLKYISRYQLLFLALLLSLAFCFSTGMIDQITGGTARITLSQPPSTMDTLYIYDTEVASAEWLKNNYNAADPVEADSVANLRLQSFSHIVAGTNAIFPQTLDISSYVYLVKVNIMRGEAFSQFDNNLLTYNYPLDFIKSNKNLIYNNGESVIYH
jgi:uncharacterized membrane protein